MVPGVTSRRARRRGVVASSHRALCRRRRRHRHRRRGRQTGEDRGGDEHRRPKDGFGADHPHEAPGRRVGGALWNVAETVERAQGHDDRDQPDLHQQGLAEGSVEEPAPRAHLVEGAHGAGGDDDQQGPPREPREPASNLEPLPRLTRSQGAEEPHETADPHTDRDQVDPLHRDRQPRGRRRARVPGTGASEHRQRGPPASATTELRRGRDATTAASARTSRIAAAWNRSLWPVVVRRRSDTATPALSIRSRAIAARPAAARAPAASGQRRPVGGRRVTNSAVEPAPTSVTMPA